MYLNAIIPTQNTRAKIKKVIKPNSRHQMISLNSRYLRKSSFSHQFKLKRERFEDKIQLK